MAIEQRDAFVHLPAAYGWGGFLSHGYCPCVLPVPGKHSLNFCPCFSVSSNLRQSITACVIKEVLNLPCQPHLKPLIPVLETTMNYLIWLVLSMTQDCVAVCHTKLKATRGWEQKVLITPFNPFFSRLNSPRYLLTLLFEHFKI